MQKILTKRELEYLNNEKRYDYFDPMNDVIFKSIFKSDKKHYLLKVIVKELLGVELDTFKEKDSGFIARGRNIRGEACDYYVCVNGKNISSECNRTYSKTLFEMNISHLNRMIIENGFDVIQINFDNYDIEKKGKLVYKYSMREESCDSTLYDNLMKIFHINLSYFSKKVYNNFEKLSVFDKMCLMFLIRDRKTLEKLVKGDEGLMSLREEIERINGSGDIYEEYTKSQLEAMARAEILGKEIAIEIAEEMAKEMAEEKAKELAEIKARELAEIKAKELAEVKAKEERLETARRMIDDNMNISKISDYTGLSVLEIEKLKND